MYTVLIRRIRYNTAYYRIVVIMGSIFYNHPKSLSDPTTITTSEILKQHTA